MAKIRSAIVRSLLSGYPRKAGFAGLTADTGDAALQAMRANTLRFDWLYTDIKPPGSVEGWVLGAEFHLGHPSRPIFCAMASAPPSRADGPVPI